MIINFLRKNIWLILIIFLAIFSRFWKLYYTPGWFPDEGVDLNIAWNLFHGKMQLSAISYTFMPHPPLFFITSIPFLAIFGKSILTLRYISAFCGVMNVVLIYLIIKEALGNNKALLGALFYTVSFEAIINGRYALTYEFFLSLVLLAILFAVKFNEQKQTRWLIWSSVFAGLASVTSFLGFIFVPFLWIWTFFKCKKNFVMVMLLSFGPFLIYAATMLILTRSAFLHDFLYTIRRPEINVTAPGGGLLKYYSNILGASYFNFLGLIGLFLIKNKYKFIIPMMFFILTIFEYSVRKTTFLAEIFIIFGLVSIIYYLYDYLKDKLARHSNLQKYSILVIILVIGLLFVVPLGLPVIKNFYAIFRGQSLNTSSEVWFAPNNLEDSQKVADFVNERTSTDNTVLASPHFSSLLKVQITDPILATVYQGYETTNFPANFGKDRFIYDASWHNVKYAVIDKFTRGWFVFQPNVDTEVLDKFWNSWPKVYILGEYTVLLNPKFE